MDSGRFGGFGGRSNNMGGGNASGESPSGRSAGDGPRKQQKPLRPVTIRQLLASQRVGDGALVIDGTEAGQVTVVGVVLNCEIADGNNGTAQHTYAVCDGTGIITIRTWTADKPADLNTYIRASGNVGSFQNNLSLTGIVRPVSNASEVPYHQMDCLLTHLRITQGTRTAGYGVPSPSSQQPSAAAQYGHQQQYQQQQPQQSVYGGPAPAAIPTPQSFGNPRDIVISAIRNAGPAGATVQMITDSARLYGLQGEVRDIIRALNAEGTVFTQNNTIYLSNQK